MSMSRIDTDFFTKNLHYATSWWSEHCENVESMMDKLMTQESLQKLAVNAAALTLKFNEKTKWINAEFNKTVIESAYTKLVEEVDKDKMFLFALLDEYFTFLQLWKKEYSEKDNPKRDLQDMANSPELMRLKRVFVEHADALNEESQLWKISIQLCGDNADKKLVVDSFLPQLMLFNLRVLDIYDSAMNGLTVDEMMELIKDNQIRKPTKQPQTEEDAIKSALGQKMLGQFGRPTFWQHRYDGMGSDFKPHDWYVSWSTIRDKVLKVAQFRDKPLNILNVGCGNSRLAEHLMQDKSINVSSVVSFDFIESVVRAQQERARDQGLEAVLRYLHLDVLTMNELQDEEFDMIVDKGTMDSVLMTTTASVDFGTACKQISRVLKPGGWFVLVSCAIGYNQIKPLQNLTEFKWRVCQVTEMPSDKNEETKINLVLIQKFATETELQQAVDDAKKQKSASISSAPATASK